MDTCKAAIFTEVEKLEVVDIKKPVPKANEVLVELKTCAICTWEQRVYKGINQVDFPFIGGHEEAGIITAVGSDIDLKLWNIGDRVVVGMLTSCGECENCRIGEESSCQNFSYENMVGGLDTRGMGGFSQYLAVPVSKLFKIADKLSYEEAALTEPLSCVVHSVELANIQLGESVVVIGAGIMGAFHAILARNKGGRVIVVEPNEQRLDFLKTLGFNELINPNQVNVVEAVLALTDNKGADIILNTVGVSKLAEESIEMSALYGRVVLYSSYHPDTPISVSPNKLHRRMTKLVGTANSNTHDFITAMKLLNEGIVDVKPFISGTYPLVSIVEGIQAALTPETYRIVIAMD
ncbi:zinc-dependent alcohol dehydrogenase [Enterococcus sp. AZ072]|uniref:zinc-dependent alcohol dehydrogenase n=1 Tax=unclassified Enterococcus TaxID=2608891 RepID=UPI003D278A20